MSSLRTKGSVRMGPISLFALIILLSLSVLAVLAASTAQATYASAEKQALFTCDTYVNEVEAQELVAFIDGELAQSRDEGKGGTEALADLEAKLPEGVRLENDTIYAEFTQDSGRSLFIALTVEDDAHYQIAQWQATTTWNTGEGETLWQGQAESD